MGSRFQADIPPVRDTLYLLYEEHPAQLVWAPWKDLSTNIETQQRGKHTNTHTTLTQYHLQGHVGCALNNFNFSNYKHITSFFGGLSFPFKRTAWAVHV